ncbi:hypothetical protein J4447_00370 [Candidatus Pacearchaeota archaeon]|nr:hypothetical protein [Candidatus Pacearchaeota archaeon]
MVHYEFKKGDIVSVSLARNIVGIRCIPQPDSTYDTKTVKVESAFKFRVLGYRGSKSDKSKGYSKLYLETLTNRIKGFMIEIRVIGSINAVHSRSPSLDAVADETADEEIAV